MPTPTPTQRRGFTLIELMISLAIVALLSTIALPISELAVTRAKEQELHSALQQIRSAIDAYKQAWDNGQIAASLNKSGYPASLEILVDGVDDLTSTSGQKIYFLRRIPRDPFATDPNLTPAETWGKRSYESSATDPQEGDDVYDVYSRAPGKSLRGIPYRDW
ncbi:MAG: prepilin-type N-terminal cleavage/methylation domain-containing protein [Gammaproteobacteria bacterium]|nr:prepilin-type N-terminal cleavage/methylation domain-containing protein [Gammaproteobacteria bacterium]